MELACKFKGDSKMDVTFYKDGSVVIETPYGVYSGKILRITKRYVIVVVESDALRIKISFIKSKIPKACYKHLEEGNDRKKEKDLLKYLKR